MYLSWVSVRYSRRSAKKIIGFYIYITHTHYIDRYGYIKFKSIFLFANRGPYWNIICDFGYTYCKHISTYFEYFQYFLKTV